MGPGVEADVGNLTGLAMVLVLRAAVAVLNVPSTSPPAVPLDDPAYGA
jgi:hypothetical protein